MSAFAVLCVGLVCAFWLWVPLSNGYELVHDYSGPSFFDGWDFYGNYDNLTLGDVWWLNQNDAFQQNLAYINNAGNVILKVDNTGNVPFNNKRASVRITTQASYAVGSLWVADMNHIPFGCSVWPAFWTKGPLWPDDGEIDIMEAINLMENNQMALHTTSGCVHSTPSNQLGATAADKLDCSQPAGCVVQEVKPNSYGAGFANAGGGVFAVQFDVAGIFIWFWSRPDVPASITQASSSSSDFMDVSDWGNPSASYLVTTCDITQFFSPQNLVLDITLCGMWAGLPEEYLPQCGGSGPTGICYNDNVVGSGSNYDDAFFEIKYVRAYTTPISSQTLPTPTFSTPTTPPITTTLAPGSSPLTASPSTYTPVSPAVQVTATASLNLQPAGDAFGPLLNDGWGVGTSGLMTKVLIFIATNLILVRL